MKATKSCIVIFLVLLEVLGFKCSYSQAASPTQNKNARFYKLVFGEDNTVIFNRTASANQGTQKIDSIDWFFIKTGDNIQVLARKEKSTSHFFRGSCNEGV